MSEFNAAFKKMLPPVTKEVISFGPKRNENDYAVWLSEMIKSFDGWPVVTEEDGSKWVDFDWLMEELRRSLK